MAYDTHLEERINHVLQAKKVVFNVKKMMGGLCYMVDGKMLCGIIKNELMARVGQDKYKACLAMDGVNPQTSFARPMKGYVFVEADVLDLDANLEEWISRCLEYNPLAKASKKK